jgi:hypothetical protein
MIEPPLVFVSRFDYGSCRPYSIAAKVRVRFGLETYLNKLTEYGVVSNAFQDTKTQEIHTWPLSEPQLLRVHNKSLARDGPSVAGWCPL